MNDFDQDPFAASRMAFGDHIEELRLRLWKALAGFGIAFVLGFFLSPYVLHFIAAPVDRALAKFHERRLEKLAERLREGDPQLRDANQPREAEILVPASALACALGLPEDKFKQEWVPLPVRIRPLDWALLTDAAIRLVSRPPSLMSLTVTEPFMVYFKVSAFCGVVLASPWIFYQLCCSSSRGCTRTRNGSFTLICL
jgi:sec-independent protein translocase protein TatC